MVGRHLLHLVAFVPNYVSTGTLFDLWGPTVYAPPFTRTSAWGAV